jgi:hypothetical protein
MGQKSDLLRRWVYSKAEMTNKNGRRAGGKNYFGSVGELFGAGLALYTSFTKNFRKGPNGTSIAVLHRVPDPTTTMDIHFVSTLTPEDEDRLAVMIVDTAKALLANMPVSYKLQVSTTGNRVREHEQIGTPAAGAEPRRPEPDRDQR